MSQQLVERAQQQAVTAGEATEAVKAKGQEVREQATGRVRSEVQDRTSAAAEQVQSFAQTMRRTASELRAQGQEGQSAILDQVAIRGEELAGYLADAEPEQLLNDAREYGRRAFQVVRRQPWLIAPVGLGVGLVASRLVGGGGDASQQS